MSKEFEAESVTIGPYNYSVTPLDAVRGREAVLRYARILSATSAAAAATAGDEEAKGIAASAAFIASFSSDDMTYFCDLFAPNTSVKGNGMKGAPQLDAIFAKHFAKRYGDMMKWLSFCFKVNGFESFFGQAKSDE